MRCMWCSAGSVIIAPRGGGGERARNRDGDGDERRDGKGPFWWWPPERSTLGRDGTLGRSAVSAMGSKLLSAGRLSRNCGRVNILPRRHWAVGRAVSLPMRVRGQADHLAGLLESTRRAAADCWRRSVPGNPEPEISRGPGNFCAPRRR